MALDERSAARESVGAVLVIGGGIGGMQAALDLADSGFYVYMVDKKPAIGGVMAQLDKTFPTNDCSMCIMAPKLVECGRHLNIEVITNSEVADVRGDPGDFTVRLVRHARYVDQEKCTGCGICAMHCPVGAARDRFNLGLGARPAIYIEYPQAVPLAYIIDRDTCIGCGLCETLCLAQAVKYDDVAFERELRVGAIIVATGFDAYDPTERKEYGYGRFPNVVTSMEFERILSASGPYEGRVLRPSDGDIPRRIAFIQCVGSRDRAAGNRYCSSVCCMYATKEAVIAKEHQPDVEATVFFMDMRSYGKRFEAYIERAKEEYGVRFIRTRVSDVEEDSDTQNLILSYETEEGGVVTEEFDLVVLSVGLVPPRDSERLAEALGISLDAHGFARTEHLNPLAATRPGVFVCGAMQGPKDIPETVTQASGAASAAGALLGASRGELTRTKTYPEEKDVRGIGPRIGVFVCHCGINIGGVVDVPAVAEYAKTLPNVVYAEENLYTCSQDTQRRIQEKVEEYGLTRVVVASCTPRTHEPLFQETCREAGLNYYLFQMANIRDQCSWVHMRNPKEATEKAKDLVKAACAKASLLQPLERIPIEVKQSALVIGGGLAGMVAALDIADQGFCVDLVEASPNLGGHLRKLCFTLAGDDIRTFLTELSSRVMSHPNINVHLSAEVEDIQGYVGNFKCSIKVRSTDGEVGDETELETEHGVIVVATGGREYVPTNGAFLYGRHPSVVTQAEFEKAVALGAFKNCEAEDGPVVMIQCVGSRDDERTYCSRVCCSEAVKNAIRAKKENPNRDVFILYRDVRTYGTREVYFEEARELGVVFIRYPDGEMPKVWSPAPTVREHVGMAQGIEGEANHGNPCYAKGLNGSSSSTGNQGLDYLSCHTKSETDPGLRNAFNPKDSDDDSQPGPLMVEVADTLLGEKLCIPAGLVVLSTGIVPGEGNKALAQMLKVPLDEDGFFLEAHMKLRPVDFATEGVFVAGLAHSPKTIDETIAQAHAAAGRAATVLAKGVIMAEGIKSEVLATRCTRCKLCVEVCQYNAIELDDKDDVAVVNKALCKGCGLCAATCRCGAITLRGFTEEEILAEVDALVC